MTSFIIQALLFSFVVALCVFALFFWIEKISRHRLRILEEQIGFLEEAVTKITVILKTMAEKQE